MPSKTVTVDPYKRHKTATPGLTYRLRADGKTKTWFSSAGDGKHVRCETRDEALETLERLRGAKRRGERVVVNSKITFAELSEQWLEARKSSGRTPLRERTARYYRDGLDLVLLPRFGKWRLTAIDAEAIAELIHHLEQEGLHAIDPKRAVRPLGKSSIENYLKPLQGVLKLALRRKLIVLNPFDQLIADDRPMEVESTPAHEWTEGELTALLTASQSLADKPSSRHDYTLLLRLSARVGLRIGEVLGLTWANFDWSAGTLRIERQWTRFGVYGPTKTKAGVRTLYLPEDLREDLRSLRVTTAYPDDESPVFASREGTPLGHRNVTRRGFEPARDLAGLDESLTFHELRHAAASRLIATGIDDELIADTLGHESSAITRKLYSHVFDREAKVDSIRKALSET